MLDIKFIRENAQKLQKANHDKNFSVDIEKILQLDAQIRPLQQEQEKLQATRNRLSKEMGKVSAEERQPLKEKVLSLKKQLDDQTQQLREKKALLHQLMLTVAQPARDDVPVGKDDEDNLVVSTWGDIPEFPFKAKSHITLGKDLDIMDFEKGVKLAGSRSYVLKNDGCLLERAVINFAFDLLVEKGFIPHTVPVLVNEAVMEGTGYFPLGREQAYCVEKDKLALVGTSEVPLASLHSQEILKQEDLPLRYMARSTCFRREAGTYGKDTKGLYRVHQFEKVEMVVLAPNDKSLTDKLHEELVSVAEELLQAFELPYRKVYVCTGDLGQGQVRKHDLEVWMPSRQSYGETHSCSSFYDFQARRLNIRYKDKETGKNEFVYTLNNTACATPRVLIPILEHYQTQDGDVAIPKCLQKYMGNRTHIKAK